MKEIPQYPNDLVTIPKDDNDPLPTPPLRSKAAWNGNPIDANVFSDMRKKLGLTQSHLALALGLSERQIRRFESGEVPIERWLDLAMKWLLRDRRQEMALDPTVARCIRNATTLDDLARIKSYLGLSEPEVLVTEEELRERVEALLDRENGLYFDDHHQVVFDEYGNELPPSELAESFAMQWFHEKFTTIRGRSIETRWMQRTQLRDFFHQLIGFSQNEFPDGAGDSRSVHIESLDAWLDEKFRPFML